MEYEDVHWIQTSRDTAQPQALLGTAMNHRVP
jgi:hypothetical protein